MINLDSLHALVAPPDQRDVAEQLADLAKTFTRPEETVAKRRTPAGVEEIPLDGLQVDHDYQRPPDWEKIAHMREHLRGGGTLPPIKVNRRPDGSLWITNGQHRAAAKTLEGHDTIHAIVTEKPTQEEASDTEIVAKIAADAEQVTLDRLRGAGGLMIGKTLVLDLGDAGQVRYTPHGQRFAGTDERGRLRVLAPSARRVVERLNLLPQDARLQGDSA